MKYPIEVEIEPTTSSKRNGFGLTLRTDSHGWCKEDLTLAQLVFIRNKLTEFIDSRNPELIDEAGTLSTVDGSTRKKPLGRTVHERSKSQRKA
jgi:hypothetical protein